MVPLFTYLDPLHFLHASFITAPPHDTDFNATDTKHSSLLMADRGIGNMTRYGTRILGGLPDDRSKPADRIRKCQKFTSVEM
jgi:hypothetical protein